MKLPFYITTPIYYVTDSPHIGTLYTTVAADIMARYQRMRGRDVFFLTGTDEHGQKIQKKAKESGETPQQLADRVVERFHQTWRLYGVTNDDFIRTTEERHKKVVQDYMSKLMETGDIYLDEYEGWYCIPDETYWTESQIIDGKCPDCGRPVERLKEESYFFRMSAYQERLLKYIDEHPAFILPESRKNEVVSFVRQGLKDISISRTTIAWGITMPPPDENAPKPAKDHKVYVWFDALTNYLSALGPLDEDPRMEKYWPHAIHLVGKDILRFHAVYWPTFLMALKLPLPKQIVAHGWLTEGNRKISKSFGNAIDPVRLAEEVGVDGVRYFLFREFVFGLDGEYTKDVVYQRINSDLANDFGNGISRVCSMILKYLGDGKLSPQTALREPSEVKEATESSVPRAHHEMEAFGFHRMLEQVFLIIASVNRHIESSAPWKLAKSAASEDRKRLETVLFHCHEALRVASLLLHPFIPSTAAKALSTLGDAESLKSVTAMDRAQWGAGPVAYQVAKPEPLYPRLELPPEREPTS